MPHVRLKGLNQVKKRTAAGDVVYWYAWKGGPRLPGKPGSPEFMSAYNAAVADRKAPRNDTLAGLITLYRSKPEYQTLADSTRAQWSRWLDRIQTHEIGSLGLRALDDPRVRADLMDWRDEFAATPRNADYGVQVLSRVLGFAVERGILATNRAAGIPHLYAGDRADLIWEPQMLAAFEATKAPDNLRQALQLACLTGLRRGDLVKLKWRQVGDLAIVISTGKSSGRRDATVPLLPEARALLDRIGRKGPEDFVLTNSRGKGWGENSLSHRIGHYAADAGVARSLHDARGTFATRLRLAGLTDTEIADILAWDANRVRRILARYVDQDRIVRALVRKVADAEGH